MIYRDLARTYDVLNRVKTYSTLGSTIAYDYDKVGNLTGLTYPGGKKVTYAYNNDNRLETVTDWLNRQLVRYEYMADGRLLKEIRNNGTVREYVYGYVGTTNQGVGELTAILEKNAKGEVIASYAFAYDLNGNITKETVSPEPTLDQLKIPAVSMRYTADNRLETYNKQTVTYDNDGNMTSGPLGSGFGAFSYDARNRLIQAGATKYAYTVEDHRVKVEQDGKVTQYVVNPHAKLSQTLIKQDPDGKETFYIYGLGLIAQVQMSSNATHFYHYDLRGSTVAMTDSTGITTDRFTYLPYGEITSHTGTTQTPFQYNGRDGVTNDGNSLYHMRARLYSSTIRRFINRDILAGKLDDPSTLNRYSYAIGDPVLLIDPSGYASDLSDLYNAYDDVRDEQVTNILVNGCYSSDSTKWTCRSASAYALYQAVAESAEQYLGLDSVSVDDYLENKIKKLKAPTDVAEKVIKKTKNGFSTKGLDLGNIPKESGTYSFIDSSGKEYIGRSVDLNRRVKEHINDGKLHPNDIGTIKVNSLGYKGKKQNDFLDIIEPTRIGSMSCITNLSNINFIVRPECKVGIGIGK